MVRQRNVILELGTCEVRSFCHGRCWLLGSVCISLVGLLCVSSRNRARFLCTFSAHV